MFFDRRNLINRRVMPVRHGAHKCQDCTLALQFLQHKGCCQCVPHPCSGVTKHSTEHNSPVRCGTSEVSV